MMLPLNLIDESLPKKGTILDLGCGEGVVANYLTKKINRKIIGIDLNAKRVPSIKTSNLQFKIADISKINIKGISGAVISDALHHMSFTKQAKAISNVYNNMNMGGVLVVKEIDKEEILRGTLSRLWDFILYPKDKIYFSKSSDMLVLLKKTGFKVIIKRPCRLFPGSTTLYICKK